MSDDTSIASNYAEIDDARTLRIQRTLPGTPERIWAYLTESQFRAKWLASGVMDLVPGATFELVWRNDDLSDSSAERPEGFSEESRGTCTVLEVDAPRRLRYRWEETGEVTFELEAMGNDVVLSVTHRLNPNPNLRWGVSAGWHAHLNVLQAELRGEARPSLWSAWRRLRAEYEARSRVS